MVKIRCSHAIGNFVFDSSKEVEIGRVAFKYDRSTLAVAVVHNHVYGIFDKDISFLGILKEWGMFVLLEF